MKISVASLSFLAFVKPISRANLAKRFSEATRLNSSTYGRMMALARPWGMPYFAPS